MYVASKDLIREKEKFSMQKIDRTCMIADILSNKRLKGTLMHFENLLKSSSSYENNLLKITH